MMTNYFQIAEDNKIKYGTDINRYGPVLLANLYSDRTHFVYEILQNAEDKNATGVSFKLYKDKLVIIHNGKLFNEKDIRGVCGLVEGTKSDDFTKIGKFGIGFKSVYAYTESPKIYSGVEAFAIDNYVQPRAINRIEKKDDHTIIILPFNHKKVSQKQAYAEISKRLQKLGLRTLLFLNNIETIRWNIINETSGSYTKSAKYIEEHIKKVRITSQKQVSVGEQEDFIIFDKPIKIDGVSGLKVETAYKYEDDGYGNIERIVPVYDSTISVFFPTEKETHLRFLIQGPYKTTPARDNIPYNDLSNQLLVKETANLVCESMQYIRQMGLLNIDFLNVMPINRQEFQEEHILYPIYNAVRDKLKSNERLLPTKNGDFINSDHAFLARGKDLADLLEGDQLSLLFNKSNCEWLDTGITQDRTPELRKYLLEELGVQEVNPEKFAAQFNEEFIKQQADDWVIAFYFYLTEQKSLWQKYYRSEGTLLSKPFIRLEGNEHTRPFDSNKKPLAYINFKYNKSFPSVKKELLKNEKVVEFLRALGLEEPDIFSEICEVIIPKYIKDEIDVSDDENISDVETIIEALSNTNTVKINEMINNLQNTFFLYGINALTGTGYWCKPRQIYLPERYTNNDMLEIYFKDSKSVTFLDELYDILNLKMQDLCRIGCNDDVFVEYRRTSYLGNYITIKDEYSNHVRGLNGFDPDCMIDELDKAIESITLAKSLVIWKIAKQYKHSIYGTIESSTNQNFYNSKKQDKPSKMGKLLLEEEWLLCKDGGFHKPCEILPSNLVEDYDIDSFEAKELIQVLNFQKDIELAFLAKLTREQQQRYMYARSLTEEEIDLIEDFRTRRNSRDDENDNDWQYDIELSGAFDRGQSNSDVEGTIIPPGPIPNPQLRRDRVHEEISAGKEDEPSRSKRFKVIPKRTWESKNNEIRVFLEQQYNGKCQICGYTFDKTNGQPYFEGLYLVSRTKSSWIDRPGNTLCLCANCCAKFLHGSVSADNIEDQILNFKCKNEGGSDTAKLKVKLCGKDTDITYTERHMLDLQELIKASKKE